MSALLQTSGDAEGAEGSDQLKDFFAENSKLDLEWYNKLKEEDIDYDDLMESAEDDLRSMLKDDCRLKGKAVTRILNAVRKIPDSVIYKILHGTKVSVVSTEEHEAAEQIQKKNSKISDAVTNITNTMQKLTENSQVCEKIINDKFDNIINAANGRRQELLKQLKGITNTKYNKLLDQQNILDEKAKQLDEFYNETQNMMKDVTMDVMKRKTKILSGTKQFVDENIKLLPATNDKINVKIDVKEINNALSQLGYVADGNGALPPVVEVKEVKYDAVTIIIRNNDEEKECIAHKLEYVQTDNDDIDDQKLDWKAVNIQNNGNNKSVEYEIKSLHKSTKYMMRAASKNKSGWGLYSKNISFKTQDFDPKKVIASQMVFDSFGRDSTKISIINEREVQCIKFDTSIRLKFAMPIVSRGNNKYNIKSISWEVTHTATSSFPNAHYFIGVVSNRTTNFTVSAYRGLQDAYGVCGNSSKDYGPFKGTGKCVKDSNYKEYAKGATIRVEYIINESTLNFYHNGDKKLYTMKLPTSDSEITHWYPCISLRDVKDVCKISKNIIIQ